MAVGNSSAPLVSHPLSEASNSAAAGPQDGSANLAPARSVSGRSTVRTTLFREKISTASMRSALSKARRLGLSRVLSYASRRAFRAVIFRKDVLLVYSLSREDGHTRESGPGSQRDLTWLDPRLLRNCTEQEPDYFTPQRIGVYERRFAHDDRCWALFDDRKLLTLGWVGLRSTIQAAPEVGSRFSVAMGEPAPVIYDCWTPPESRRRGFYSRAIQVVASGLLQDHERVWMYCLEANEGSARGIQKAGFRPSFTHVRRRFLGVERHLTSPVTS